MEPLSTNNIRSYRQLARAISLVENESPGFEKILESLDFSSNVPVIGITGPPGAGKSTLTNALVTILLQQDKKIAVIAVDPSSPFNFGALLGDRIRLSSHYNNPNVYIRSLASRGSLGGLSEKIIEVVDVVKTGGFDYIFVETVGVGQSEVAVAGLADTSIVVVVPESGDEVQTMKAGLMEIADIFVVNKADRSKAARFVKNLKLLVHSRPASDWNIPVLKTIATQQEGILELIEQIEAHKTANRQSDRRSLLLTQKAVQLIQKHRMQDLNIAQLKTQIQSKIKKEGVFNIYTFLKKNYFS